MKLFVSPINASRFFSAPCFSNITYTDISDGRSELRSYVKKRSGNAVELVHDSNRLRRVVFPKDLVSADVPYLADLSYLFGEEYYMYPLVKMRGRECSNLNDVERYKVVTWMRVQYSTALEEMLISVRIKILSRVEVKLIEIC